MTVYLFVEFVHSFNFKIETDYKLLLLETKVLYFFIEFQHPIFIIFKICIFSIIFVG